MLVLHFSSECSVADATLTCDPLIQYLVESTNEKTDVCANCDKVCKKNFWDKSAITKKKVCKQINQPMFFCETCHQPLCSYCKDETHHAKMFATHKIVLHEERTGASAVKKCSKEKLTCILYFLQELF